MPDHDFDAMLAGMQSRLPRYRQSLAAIEAYVAALEKSPAALFAWAPMVDGAAAVLPPAVESRCGEAVLRELRESARKIREHVARVEKCEEESNV